MTITTHKVAGSPFTFALQSGPHTLTIDLPADSGGNDLGPGAHDLFDGALAACTALTLTLYAGQKQWPLEDVRVVVTRDDSAEKNGLYRLHRQIELVGTLDDTQRSRLLQIADKCPIHKLMHATIEIQTTSI